MRRIDVEKKRARRWPWLLGLLVLAGIAWGITILLRPPPQPEPPSVATSAGDTLPPAAIPMPPGNGQPAGRAGRALTELAPIDADDAGQALVIRGEVVATGVDGFWLLADDHVLQVVSAQLARKGDSVAVAGTLRTTDGERTRVMATEVLSRHPEFDRWKVVEPVVLVETDDGSAG